MARSKRRPPQPSSQPQPQQQTVLQQTTQAWSGPLPPPGALQAFEDVCPGSAAQIVEEFRTEAAHRRQLERQRGALAVRETHVGQALAAVFSLSALAVAAYAAYVGAEFIGTVIGGTMIVGVTVALIRGRRQD